MKIVSITPSVLDEGREVARAFPHHRTGLEIVPGAILRAMDKGFVSEGAIIGFVAEVSRCRPRTVATILHHFTDDDSGGGLWAKDSKGHFAPIPDVAVRSTTALVF